MIRNAILPDAGAICAIYNPHVTGTIVTFEEQEVSVATMRERISGVTATYPWLVFEENGVVGGYSYASQWRVRSAFRYSVETTVYVAPQFHRRGIGTALYRELIERLRALGMHRAVGGIALPNAASVALHESLGFRKVAHFDESGRKFDRWIDVGYWQLDL
jgi:phosphinothricin acetyltransferase